MHWSVVGFQGFDEYSLLMKEIRQVIALYMKDSLRKSISVMKQSLMVLVLNASWISCHICFTFLWNIIIGCTWQTRKSGIFSTCSSLQTSSITSKLWAELSVTTKSTLFTKSLSLNFQAVYNILYVISWSSFKLALDSVNIFKVGNARYLPSTEKDWTM